MALKHTIDKEGFEALSEAEQAHYSETDGSYYLEVQGMVPNARLNEFRENNVKLKEQLEAYGGITADDAIALDASRKKYEASQAKNTEEIEKLVEKRTAEMKAEHERSDSKKDELIATQRGKLEKLMIDGELAKAGDQVGLKKGAADDLLARGRTVFRLEDDKAVAYNGEEKLYGVDGQPLTMKEWAEGLVKTAPHLFEPSSGSAAAGSNRGPGNQGAPNKNPWLKESRDVDLQGRIFKEDPAMAKRLMAAAGVPQYS